ncbi:AMP-binding protein [Geitlerinema calcuttense]|uniref:AMP-binding protein n=1 Tax=Geitlerinema calcuttense TaxID=1471433 RepID=UPI0032E802F6
MESQVTLISLFEQSQREQPGKVAVVYDGQKITYRDIDAKVRKLALSLTAMGVRKGDRVGILLRNSPDYIFAFYGALFCGAAVVPVNHMLKAGEIEYILNDCQVKVLVSSGDFRDVHQALRGKLPGLTGIYFVEHEFSEAGRAAANGFPRIYSEDIAVIIYTSGTTGKPKGAMLPHRAIVANVKSCEKILGAYKGDRFALLLPMFHSFMMTVCMALPLSIGASILLIKSLSPAKIFSGKSSNIGRRFSRRFPSFFRP